MRVFLDIPLSHTRAFDVCAEWPLEDLVAQASALLGHDIAGDGTLYIAGRHGISAAEALAQPIAWMSLRGRTLGGKGGFGSMLRSQGSKMATNKPANYDNCRDLYGRRLKTLREAKTIVENLEAEEHAKEAAAERRRKKIADGLKETAPKKYRFDDVEYTRNCEEIVESTKQATRKAFKKKTKEMHASAGESSSSTLATAAPLIPLFVGDMSSSEDSSSESENDSHSDVDGKGESTDSSLGNIGAQASPESDSTSTKPPDPPVLRSATAKSRAAESTKRKAR
ncbi:hypothetical protein GGI04_003807 [Coemansia thaxteri]|nr:hypothetical protein GGI04_003807 [Coemansia thaxteri]KAJ2471494.1 hypothetical protein GGI02_002239 [Coemansia sp. RSA 2322]